MDTGLWAGKVDEAIEKLRVLLPGHGIPVSPMSSYHILRRGNQLFRTAESLEESERSSGGQTPEGGRDKFVQGGFGYALRPYYPMV